MRILIVEGTGTGFLNHYAHALALGFADRGERVRLVSRTDCEFGSIRLPLDRRYSLPAGARAWWRLRHEVRAFRPDVVHLQWVGHPVAALVFVRWCQSQGVRVVYTPHNLLPHRNRWLSQPFFRALYHAVDAVVARDSHLAWGLEEIIGLDRASMSEMPGSPNLIASPLLEGSLPAEVAALPPARLRLLQFGHGGPKKGTGQLVESLLNCPDLGGVQLVLAGQGVVRGVDPDRLAALVTRMPVVVLDRYLAANEAGALFRACDLLLQPYLAQCNSPQVDLARALDLPVLLSDRVEHPDFQPGIHGWCYPASEPDALRAALERLIAAPEAVAALRTGSGAAGELRLVSRLCDQHAVLYRRLCRAGRKVGQVVAIAPEVS